MKKRWICGLLAAALIFSLLPGMPMTVKAVEENNATTYAVMTVSDELVDVLKTMEGFAARVFWDYAQYTVGYGTRCPDDKVEYYKNNDITIEEAEELLFKELRSFEGYVNNFVAKYGLKLEQHQFDALVSFSYNVGPGWMNSKGGYLLNSVVHRGSDAQFIYGMTLWSKAGGDYILQRRRLCEANMYLNGVYKAYNTSGSLPDHYRYVFLDGNSGTVNYAIHGFDASQPIAPIVHFTDIPTGVDQEGKPFVYEFAGWFTERTGGTEVTVLDDSVQNGSILYAQWKVPEGEIVPLPVGDEVGPMELKVTASSVQIWSGPGTHYSKVNTLAKDSPVTITEVYYISDVNWGKCDQGWLNLANTDYAGVIANRPKEFPQWGTVSGNEVRLRTGPGVSYDIVTEVNQGTRVEISEEHYDGTYNWGKIVPGVYDWGTVESEIWICVDYVTYDPEEEVVITEITIQKLPTILEYVQMQDVLEPMGSVLIATYSDGSIKAMTINDSMTSGYSNAELGTNTVTVSYGGFTTTFDVTIIMATVTFLNEDGTVLSTTQYPYGETVVEPEVPPKPNDGTLEYKYMGWDKPVTTCDGDAVYTAVFKPIYTVTFQNYDGTELSTQRYAEGETVAEPEAPVKPSDENGEYRFVGWDQEVTVCQGDVIYTAVFKPVYTITFQNYDGTVLSSTKYVLDAEVTAPEAPTREGDVYGTYEFLGWDQEVTVCQGDAVYTAVFKLVLRKYTVTFLNDDGTVLSATEYTYGQTVQPPATPTKPADESGEYAFVGWDKEVTACEGDAVYTAVFQLIPKGVPGDFDQNETVNEDDAVYLLGHILFPDWYPVHGQADLNSDGVVNEDDAAYLLGYILFPDWYPLP